MRTDFLCTDFLRVRDERGMERGERGIFCAQEMGSGGLRIFFGTGL